MAETATTSSTSTSGGTPPIDYMIAVMLGMPHDQIERGLREGWVAKPAGAPDDWAPPWVTADSTGSVGDGRSDDPQVPPTPGGEGGKPEEGGGSIPTVDRAQVQRWMQGLDPALTSSAFDQMWNSAGKTDQARGDALFGYLRRALLDGASETPLKTTNGVGDVTDPVAALSAFIADPAHHAHVVSLTGKDGAEIASLGRTDIGYRYALVNLDTVALTGNRALFASRNAEGELDRFDADTGDANMTDSWIADRAKFLAWKMHSEDGGEMSASGAENWTFIDRTLRDSSGNPMKLEITGDRDSAKSNQVIFGANDTGGETLEGGDGTDRVYGGSGNDTIGGGARGDHLEGGRGDDVL
ncbi:MAG: hypothetical protein ABI569_13735, partial [Casimicrobiaceae bacterium]